jgi:hypothetical protein
MRPCRSLARTAWTFVADELASALRAAALGLVVRRTAVTAITLTEVHGGNPLETIEHLATGQLWSFERACEDELVIVVPGKWVDYQATFTWMHGSAASCLCLRP